MDYYITEEEYEAINERMPQGLVFAYHDHRGKHIHNTRVFNDWNVDIDAVINFLYDITYQEFLEQKFDAMRSDPIYVAEVIDLIYVPIGKEVIQRFMGRNGVAGINLLQSEHVMDRACNILQFLSTGSIPNAIQALSELVPDDMSEDKHWITQERKDSVMSDINSLLPPPPEPEPSPI